MTEASSFTSLLALIDNHLSQTNVQASHSDGTGKRIQNTFPASIQASSLSDASLTLPLTQRLPIPTFKLSENTNPIQIVLAEQVANMLKAKDKKKKEEEEEKQRLQEEMKRLKVEDDDNNDGSDCIIDLMAALRTPFTAYIPKQETFSISSSQESLFEPKFIDCDSDTAPSSSSPEPQLPCTMDMSYILKAKIKGGKCSSFGKVFISRLRPVAAPYIREKYACNVVPFDFNTKSPCDLIKEKLRKPTSYYSYY